MSRWTDEVQRRWERRKYWVIPGLLLAVALVAGGAIIGNSSDSGGQRGGSAQFNHADWGAPGAASRYGHYHYPRPAPTRNSPLVTAERVAREVCAASGLSRLAKELGVPNNISAVVHAYGEVSTFSFRPASERGCLEGLSG